MRVDFFMGRGPRREWLGYLDGGNLESLRAAIAPVLAAGSQENYRAAVAKVDLIRDGSVGEAGATVDYFAGRAYFHADGPGEAKKPQPGATLTTPTAAPVSPEGEAEATGTPVTEGSATPEASASPVSEEASEPKPPRRKKRK